MSDNEECEFEFEGDDDVAFDDSDVGPSYTAKKEGEGRKMEKLIEKADALCYAILKESPDALDSFDGDINLPCSLSDYAGFTPFCMAAHCGRMSMYRKMVFDLHADPTICSNGLPPITFLIRNDPYYCRAADNIPEMVHCGADPNDQCRTTGRPPLAEAHRLNIALALVKNGAGKSLHYTVRGGSKQLWQFLPNDWLPQLFAAAGEKEPNVRSGVSSDYFRGVNQSFDIQVGADKMEEEVARKASVSRAIREDADEEAARKLMEELEAPPLARAPPDHDQSQLDELAVSDPELALALRNSMVET